MEVVHLTGEVIVENLFTGGDLNGIDVSRLWADSVHDTKGLVTIKGRKTFAGKTTFAKNMHVVHDINGFGYPQHLKTIVTIDGQNQVISVGLYGLDYSCGRVK